MTKKPQPPSPESSDAFERAVNTATDESIPASDITRQLEAEGLELLDIGFPEAAALMLKARDEIERLRGQWLPIESAPSARIRHNEDELTELDPMSYEDMRRFKAMEGKRVRLVVVGEGDGNN